MNTNGKALNYTQGTTKTRNGNFGPQSYGSKPITAEGSTEPLEKAILGEILLNPSLGLELDIHPYMFEVWRNVADQIWKQLTETGSTNAQTIAHECKKLSICSTEDIWSLVANIGGNIKEHSTRLKTEWVRRQEIDIYSEALAKLQAGENPVDVVASAESAREMVGGFSEDHNRTRVDRTNGFLDGIYAAKSGKRINGWSSGFRLIDAMTGGFRLNRFTMLGARPGMGKTTLTLQYCIALAEQGVGVAFFCYEMPFDIIMQAVVQMKTGIPRERMESGQMTDDEIKQIERAAEWFYELPLFIEDYPYNYSRLMMRIRQYNKKYKVSMFFIDYIQRISNDVYKGNRKDLEVGEMSTGMANLTISEPLSIVALSQLSRECEKRADKRPVESDVRESGSLEADARQMSFIYRSGKYYPEGDDPRTEILIRKNSYSGKTGTVYMIYDPVFNTYKEAICQKWEYDGSDDESVFDNKDNETFNPNITGAAKSDESDIPF